MEREELKAIANSLILLGQLIQDLKLEEFIHAQRVSQEVGWFMDPTLWRAGASSVKAVKELANAGLKFQKASRHFNDFIIERENDPVFQKEREKQIKLGNI